MIRKLNTGPVAHIRFRGTSRDVELASLGIERIARTDEVRARVARLLEVDERELAGHVIEVHENGNITVRPEAVFG